MISQRIEEQLRDLPILESAVIPVEDILFSERVRTVCREECPRYGTSWSCPPAVGTVDECRKQCQQFRNAFVFSTIAQVNDITNMEETLATRADHELITMQVRDLFREQYGAVLTLSTESCDLCAHCSYPDAPCRQPDKMFPCVESYGILVTQLAERGGMTFDNGANIITWFSAVFYND